ncbi:alpha/beta hydrolase [Sphingosinicella rhizophila]|uniref:Acyl-CoA:diacylglycerol acyltransferase n=1 Tax=Sphingosinicella rhizophila TaxID=3050082 RepID=A0ABU3QC95_9SPHN|nr:alpha/beta hydrolase-fold protein [Sphingosinicella sp. GR2756]MDT9601014.1 alpha/beta hydrolase-fold protein [Sphingosinicella sp. GR2756]
MPDTIDRRTLLAMTGGTALAAAMPAAVKGQARASGLLSGIVPPLSAMLPNTDYFEIDSVRAGARYAIWVTRPAHYERQSGKRFPVVYMPDGNGAAPQTAPRIELLASDPINPIRQFIQVCVGYTGADADRSLAVRARDLLPPGEALPPGVEEGMRATVETGLIDQAGADLYLHNLRNPAADKFLAFLTEELHPLIAKRYRVQDEDAGLFGYSYGGLFATYVALSRSSLFRRIGAGSPGILAQKSKIFEMYGRALAEKADHSGRMLHMTVAEREITVPSYYQTLVGAGTTEFIALASLQPLPGLVFSSKIIPEESHATGYGAAWSSFLRTCYSAAA